MLAFGPADSSREVYIVSDWFCPACRVAEPEILNGARLAMKQAKVIFVDYPIHQETLNYIPYNLSFMAREKEKYLQIREALAALSQKTKEPTPEDVQAAVSPLGVKYVPLSFADVLAGTQFQMSIVQKYKPTGTPQVIVTDSRTGKTKTAERQHGDHLGKHPAGRSPRSPENRDAGHVADRTPADRPRAGPGRRRPAALRARPPAAQGLEGSRAGPDEQCSSRSALREELATVMKELSRKRDIAERLPPIAKKITEKLPESVLPARASSAPRRTSSMRARWASSPPRKTPPTTPSRSGRGIPPEWQGKIRVASDEGLLGIAIRKKIVAARIDPQATSGLRASSRSLEQMGIPPDFAAPVFGISGIIGVLVITGCPYPLEEERKYVSMLADLFSMAIQKAYLVDATKSGGWKDELTGLSTRLHFLQRFETEIRRTGNYQLSFALFMFDIDKFKTDQRHVRPRRRATS